MEYPYFRRQQRSKGKQTLLVLLLLAVSVWLVYQIKHSINKKSENYDGETKLVEQFVATPLGRKVIPSWLEETAMTNSRNVHVAEAKNKDSDGEYVFDGTMADKVEVEFEGEQVEKEQKRKSKKHKNADYPKENSGKTPGADDNNRYPKTPSAINDSQNHDKESEMQIRESENVVRNIEETELDGPIKENGEDEETKISEEEANMQQNEDRIHIFQDENGVPSDENEIELVGGQKLMKEIVYVF